MSSKILTVDTTPFNDQKPGTSGLRKRVKIFEGKHYTENFIQSILEAIPGGCAGKTLVVGGDGRYHVKPTVQTIIKIAAGNGVKKLIIGQDGILSTPAASNVIRKRKADGGILLTASHNPGGPDNDFGIKYNMENGGPAPEKVTDEIFAKSKSLKSYKLLVPESDDKHGYDIATKASGSYLGKMDVEIIDPVTDYLELMESIFDFDLINDFFKSNPDFKILFDGLHGVTGPYGRSIFVETLGLGEESIQNCVPLPDFGGGHPDPNLIYAHSLVDAVEEKNIPFGAASDGDGDRNMIYGKGAFVTPCDSVAIIADKAECIPYFKNGIHGLARSMPTSQAIDRVAKAKNFEYFEVPTGWKFFGNLMDAGRLSICGEESFGTGSDHIREKDGIWAVMAWLNIIAAENKGKAENKPVLGIKEILQEFYGKYGRNFFSRYDYEEVSSEGAKQLVDRLDALLDKKEKFKDSYPRDGEKKPFKVAKMENFSYTDPIDNSVSKNQGHIITFDDGSRIIFRLSGTGSSGATVRMYVERYSDDPELYPLETAKGLESLISVALEISNLEKFLNRTKPNVIT